MSDQDDLFPDSKASLCDDIIIIGGGLAGLFCALKMAPRPVTVLAAAPIGTGASSAWAQAGIAAAITPGDTVDKHVADTVMAGAGTVDEEVARLMANEASERIHDLLEYGVPFDRDLEGHLVASREAAHSENRVIGVQGDRAGKAIMEALVTTVKNTPSIRLLENYVADEILVENGQVAGLIARGERGKAPHRTQLPAKSVIMASGGVGHLYEITTNPEEARGGGCGMAARAGAVIADAEFVQFHPTAINVGKDPSPLATEALRGEGCTLHNNDGDRFMLKVHELAELAPRDIVAKAIFEEVTSGRGAWLDAREAIGDHFAQEFPTVHQYCVEAGIDPTKEMIPVIPAAHYHMGGIFTDIDGQTSIDGLFACGEVTSTGAHGANRLASNSLLEAVVFAGRIAERVKEKMPNAKTYTLIERPSGDAKAEKQTVPMPELRALMSRYVGVSRNADGIKEAIKGILALEKNNTSKRFMNSLTTAKLIAVSALLREESRGGHQRTDFPEPLEAFKKRTFMTLKEAERVVEELFGDLA